MKRKTFVRYFGVLSVSLVIMSVTAVFSLIEYFLTEKKIDSETAVSVNADFTVIIDPGHGGEDGGAVGNHLGTLEKDINLLISQELHRLFVLTDIDAVMTRTEDVMLYQAGQESSKKMHDIRNRALFVNQYNNPVFVSIHQNKFPLEKYSGLQVYYSKNHADSKTIAENIQNCTAHNLQRNNNRKIKQAGRNIYLMHNLKCPAVLVECGFLSNRNEELLLNDEDYRKKIAFIIFSSLIDYACDDV